MGDALREGTSNSLRAFFASNNTHFPIESFDLLRLLLAFNATSDPSSPHLRLTDIGYFESYLEHWARYWEHGTLVVVRDDDPIYGYGNGGLSVVAAQLHPDGHYSRKRKRGEEDIKSDTPAATEPRLPLAATMVGMSKADRTAFSLLSETTAKARLLAEQHASTTGVFEPICPHITRDDCAKYRDTPTCEKVHFRPLIRPHTDPALGHCSYLNTCYSEPTYAMSPSIHPLPSVPRPAGAVALPSGLGAGGRGKEKAPCRYLHFEVDLEPGEEIKLKEEGEKGVIRRAKEREAAKMQRTYRVEVGLGPVGKGYTVLPPQWLNRDLRRFDYSVLGKFHVIMADPPWDIHMSLPYGTMTDDEMRSMPIPILQDEGLLFLWVTGRAMEVGRECLRAWGYQRIDEIIWVKTNQLQRVIRTGRTGHWLNHTKEHMLVCVKLQPDGSLKIPPWVNRGLDVDVIVSEVRETSRKPDEAYGLIERMCPGGRKVEIFGRQHNTRPGWLTLGNQLGTDQIFEEDMAARINERYPERGIQVIPLPDERVW